MSKGKTGSLSNGYSSLNTPPLFVKLQTPEVSGRLQRSVAASKGQWPPPEVSGRLQRSVSGSRDPLSTPEVSGQSQKSVVNSKGQWPILEVLGQLWRSVADFRDLCSTQRNRVSCIYFSISMSQFCPGCKVKAKGMHRCYPNAAAS